MERTRTSDSETTRQDREGSQMPASARAAAEALQAALARIAVLERRELALRAALAASGVDPDAVLARLDLLETARQVPAHVEPPLQNGRLPVAVVDAPAPGGAAEGPARSQAARSLAQRLADEVIAGPATLRLRAAARLVDVAGAAAAPALITAAREAEGALRAGLLEQVGRCGAADAAASVVEFFADEMAEVRAAAIEAAVRLVTGEELAEVVRIGLADGDARVRRRTALCAAAARNLDAGPLLVPLLADPDRQVRRVVCTALGGSRDPMAALALVGALLDDEPAVRNAAGSAAEKLFGEQARGIVQLPAQQRARAVSRLRSWVAANLVRLAPGGRLQPVAEAEQVVDAAPAAVESVLDELMATGHPGAGFEDDLPGWTEENDPELHAAFARMAGGWIPEIAADADEAVLDEAASLYDEADAALGVASGDEDEAAAAAERVAAEEAAAAAERAAAEEAAAAAERAAAEEAAVAAERAAAEEAAAAAERAAAEEAAAAAERAATEEAAAAERAAAEEAAAAAERAAAEEAAAAAERAAAEEAAAAERAAAERAAAETAAAADEAANAGPPFEAIEEVLRAALRGCTDEALAEELGWDEAELAPVIEEHLTAERLVRRGRKLFLP